MRVAKITIRNFRLLDSVQLKLGATEPDATTVVVGRNNSGKTSLTEVFRRFISQPSKFKLEDFSAEACVKFCSAASHFATYGADAKLRQLLPAIELRISVEYPKDLQGYGPLGPFIIDLNEEATSTDVVARYELANGRGEQLLEGIDPPAVEDPADEQRFLRELRDRIPATFTKTLTAEDPLDAENTRRFDAEGWKPFDDLFSISFINAQRGLDDVTDRDSNALGRLFETLFTAADASPEPGPQKDTSEQLKDAVDKIRAQLENGVNAGIQGLAPELTKFGYPGLKAPAFRAEVELATDKLLINNTRVRYSGHGDVHLPESYNGLGSRNLIHILLKLLGFYREFYARGTAPGIHLVFLEEPEAHLHPQMQEVFIRQLNGLVSRFPALDGHPEHRWPAQFVVSTHSSHIANEAPFTALRYFLARAKPGVPTIRSTVIRDLSDGLPGADVEFLHQYLTLTRVDLFFADKVILVEGTAERLLLPRIIRNFELNAEKQASDASKLTSQYIGLLEVGGAYADKFFPLLEFLQIPALVITDIDSVHKSQNEKGNTSWNACCVTQGARTSNSTIKKWFDDAEVAPAALVAMGEAAKIKGLTRLAYQVPEEGDEACGRTLEDAFALANPEEFQLSTDSPGAREIAAAEAVASHSKSGFALKFAVEKLTWNVPRYIHEGLSWLLAVQPEADSTTESSATPESDPAVAVRS